MIGQKSTKRTKLSSSVDSTKSRKSGGRPECSFRESSDRSKRRKTQELRKTHTTDELSYATKMSLRESGAVSAAKVVNDVTFKSSARAMKYISVVKEVSKMETKMSPNTALALVLDAKLTKLQYVNIRLTTKLCNSKVFPSYNSVLEAKKQCYPPDISITQKCAEVQL